MKRNPQSRSLTLWMNGALVGTWSMSAHGETLQYHQGWIDSAQGRPLSLSLPFMPGNPAHRGAVVRNYFDNLLPDSTQIRERIARRYLANGTDAFALLAQVGRDCVGALQILPQDSQGTGLQAIQASELSDTDVARLLRESLTPSPLGLTQLDPSDDFRISIAGAQEKTALLRVGNKWCLPHGATPTTHILKLPLGMVGGLRLDLRESVENEWLCARILATYGMPVAPCEIVTFDDLTVLAVERFDRAWWTSPAGQPCLIRLPQEDMCQATGTPPWQKYEADGGPGAKRIMDILSGALDPVAARRNFFKAQVLFWMLWATDGHAKNFSIFIRPGGQYAPTPLYDVLSVHPILGEGATALSPFKARMAMAVRSRNDHWKMRDILPRHWLAMGQAFGIVGEDGAGPQAILDELAARTPEVIETVRQQLPPGFPAYVAERILDGLARSARLLAP